MWQSRNPELLFAAATNICEHLVYRGLKMKPLNHKVVAQLSRIDSPAIGLIAKQIMKHQCQSASTATQLHTEIVPRNNEYQVVPDPLERRQTFKYAFTHYLSERANCATPRLVAVSFFSNCQMQQASATQLSAQTERPSSLCSLKSTIGPSPQGSTSGGLSPKLSHSYTRCMNADHGFFIDGHAFLLHARAITAVIDVARDYARNDYYHLQQKALLQSGVSSAFIIWGPPP